jgi:hypothetical protein
MTKEILDALKVESPLFEYAIVTGHDNHCITFPNSGYLYFCKQEDQILISVNTNVECFQNKKQYQRTIYGYSETPPKIKVSNKKSAQQVAKDIIRRLDIETYIRKANEACEYMQKDIEYDENELALKSEFYPRLSVFNGKVNCKFHGNTMEMSVNLKAQQGRELLTFLAQLLEVKNG